MGKYHPILKSVLDKRAMVNDSPDMQIMSQSASRHDVAVYIRSMLVELRDMANGADLAVLTYFIEMALEEAATQVRYGKRS